MLVWGYDDRMQALSPAGIHYCSTCAIERPFTCFLSYRRNHLWFLFSFVTDRHYYQLCDVCHDGFELEARVVEPALSSNPIPFHTRYSWVALVALIVFIVVWAVRDSPPSPSPPAAPRTPPSSPSGPDKATIST